MNKKFINYRKDMKTYKISGQVSAPPIFRLLWLLGIPVLPPLFLSFTALMIFSGGLFAAGWGSIMHFFVWTDASLVIQLGAPFITGAMFGLVLSTIYKLKSKALQLPSWKEYSKEYSIS